MRQDPDVILVGEIRDAETAAMALRAALTGHLVLTTLHTHDALGVMPRLKDLGVPMAPLAEVLLGILSQRLLRIGCIHCAYQGCFKCHFTGYKGRQALAELVTLNTDLRHMIAEEAPRSEIIAHLKKHTHRTIADEAHLFLKDSKTSQQEIQRVLGHGIF